MGILSRLKKSGGFLNNVDGVITGYRFTDETPSHDGPQEFKPGKVKGADGKLKEKFHTLYMELLARADGAEEDSSTYLFMGGADDYTISEDGLTLMGVEKGAEVSIGANTAVGILLASLVEAGFDDNEFDEDVTLVNFEPMVGARVRFVQKRDEETTKKLGKRQGKGKNAGKSFDRTNLVIDQYYGQAASDPTPAVTKTTTSPSKVAAKTVTKGNGKAKVTAPVVEEVDIAELSARVLAEVVRAAGGTTKKNKMSVQLMMHPEIKGKPIRDEVRTFVFDDDNLAAIASAEGGSYDPSTGVVVIPGK